MESTKKQFNILVHADRYTMTGHWSVVKTDPPEALNDLQKKAITFNYLITLDNENYLIHPEETAVFATLISQLPARVHTNFTFRIVTPDGQIEKVDGQGTLNEISITPAQSQSPDSVQAPEAGPGLETWPFDMNSLKNLLQSVVEAFPAGLSLLTPVRSDRGDIVDFRFQLVNNVVIKQTGFLNLKEKRYSELASEINLKIPLKDLIAVVDGNKSLNRNILVNRQGHAFWLNLTAVKLEDQILVVSEDITQSIESEYQIGYQRILFTKIIESSPDIIQIVNLQSGRSAYINKMLLEVLQYPFEDIKQIENENKLTELIHPDDGQIYKTLLAQIVDAGNEDTVEAELRWRAYNGRWMWFRTRAKVFDRDENGTPLKFLAFSQNVTDQKMAEEEKRKHQLLREMEKARTTFFNHVSHEFRTPLTLILAPLQEMIQRRSSSKTETNELEMAYRNALRLQKLVNSLLDFASIESGKLEAIFRPTDLSKFTTDLASNFRPIIERSNLKFVVKCEELSEPVYVNREMYEKILFNLLSNAFKFTFEGKIAVKVTENKNHVKLIVSDTGIGIRADQINKIFDRFVRIESAKSRTYEGSGIGLSLVRELVRFHGATIKVSSEPGEGTQFTVILLKGKSHLRTENIFESRGDNGNSTAAAPYIEELKSWTTDLEGIEDDRIYKKKDTGGFPVHKPFVLVVDDNSDMRAYLKNLLADDYEVGVAANGKAALESIHQGKFPALILSDVMMPELDGYELLQAIRANELTADIPVILVSARAGDQPRIEGLRSGADDYLVKPFSAKEMLARVDARIQIARARQIATQALLDANRKLEQKIEERIRALQQANPEDTPKNADDLDDHKPGSSWPPL